MDQRAHDVEEDVKHILQIRLALADKIDTLERQMEATVESTKAAALDVLDLARDKAAGFIDYTTEQLNPSVQARRRPWIMVGSALALGFFAGMLERRQRDSRIYRYYPPEAGAADVMPEDGRSHEPRGVYPFYGREEARPSAGDKRSNLPVERSRPQPAMSERWKPLRTLWEEIADDVVRERDKLRNTVLLAGRSFIQDIVQMAGQSLLDQLGRSGESQPGRQGPRRVRYE